MDKKLVIKMFKLRKKSKNSLTKIIVVGWNDGKVNGSYIDKIGSCGHINTFIGKYGCKSKIVCFINTRKLVYWINKGAIVKSKISWLVGLLGMDD